MQFIDSNVVVISAFHSHYLHHAPLAADYSLAKPYQAPVQPDCVQPKPLAKSCAARGGTNQAAEVRQPQQGASAPADGIRPRKRRRNSSYQPNEREQQSAVRHAAYSSQLEAAALTVQSWLQRSGACSIQAALAATAAPSGDTAAAHLVSPQRRQSLQLLPGSAHPRCSSSSSSSSSSSGDDNQGGGQADQPDYLALFELRHVLKPKLRLLAPSAPPQLAAKSAVAATTQQDARQPPLQRAHEQACNLFDCLVDCASFSPSPPPGTAEEEHLAEAGGHLVVLPPRSRFLLSDVRRLQPLLDDVAGYHCILLDPPWENKSAKRCARYPTLPSRNLLALPMRQLMHPEGCLVAMWVTNRERHRRFIDAELLPGWRLRHLATWHWLKVTDGGEPVGRLDIQHRRPYESLLLCWPEHLAPPPAVPQVATGGFGFHLLQGQPLVVAAVPPAAHSRKPHLGPLLQPLLPADARCLEMFARELTSGWTSWGNEVLKFQSRQHLVPLGRGRSAS